MSRPAHLRPSLLVVAVVGAALAFPSPGLAGVRWEASVRITDALGRGTVDLDEAMRTVVAPSVRREEVTGVRRMTSRRGRRYDRPGHVVTLQLIDAGATYDLDLDAGSYTVTPFADQARERDRQLREAEAAFREVPPAPSSRRPVTVQRSEGPTSVNGIECSTVRFETSRDVAVMPLRDQNAPPTAPARYTMTLEACLTPATEWAAEVRTVEQHVRELTGETDAYLDRLLDVLARRRDLFAVFDDLHYRLERERRKLDGLPIHWVQEMKGPYRGDPEATMFRLEGTVKTLEVGPVANTESAIPGHLTRVDTRRVKQ